MVKIAIVALVATTLFGGAAHTNEAHIVLGAPTLTAGAGIGA